MKNIERITIVENVMQVSLIVILLASIVSFILNFIYKKENVYQKMNSIASYFVVFAYVFTSYKLFEYLTSGGFYAFSTYIYVYLNYSLVFAGVVITTINFISKRKFLNKLNRTYEVVALLLCTAMALGLIFGKSNDKIFASFSILSLIVCEYFIVYTNETLVDKTSKNISLFVNAIITLILLICLIALVIKISFTFDLALVFLSISILLIALVPLLTAYKTLKRKKNND